MQNGDGDIVSTTDPYQNSAWKTLKPQPDLSKPDNTFQPERPYSEDYYKGFASEVYKPPDQRGSVRDGWEYDNALSDTYTGVWNHKIHGPHISYRGTKDTSDLLADLHVATGSRSHPRFREALDKYDAVKAKYGRVPSISGHSLGGTVAHHVEDARKGDRVITHLYHPGSKLWVFGNVDVRPNVIVRDHPGDLVSQGYHGGRGSVVGTLTTHKLSQS